MLVRKRTKMVDQRVSRSKISAGIDPQQLLAAQHAAQHGPSSSRIPSPSPGHTRIPSGASSPPLPGLPAKSSDDIPLKVSDSASPSKPNKPEESPAAPPPQAVGKDVEPMEPPKVPEEPASKSTEVVKVIDASPPEAAEATISSPRAETPPPPAQPGPGPGPEPEPARPEIPPPPPPAVSPAPATYHIPPRPVFLEELEHPPKSEEPYTPPPPVEVPSPTISTPPRQSPDSAGSGDSGSLNSRSQVDPDKPLSNVSKTSLKRTGSGTGVAERVRGARPLSNLSGRNTPTSTAASSIPSHTRTSSISGSTSRSPVRRGINVFNRNSGQTTPEQAREYAPRKNIGKANASLFSRRTVASDAEDNILDK